MSNYDYNKGYRWFRFQKDSSIDSSLPPLSSYRSMREVSPLLWMSHAEHVANNERGHFHTDTGLLSKSNDNASLHLPIILAASISNASNTSPTLKEHSTVDVGEHNTEQVHMDTLGCSLYVPTPTLLLGSDKGRTEHDGFPRAVSSHNSGTKRTPAHKVRTKRAVRKNTKGLPCIGPQKNLDDCLFIQNGIQRFPANHKGFLSQDKEKEIKEWINKSNK